MIDGKEFVARQPALTRALAALGEHAAREDAKGREPKIEQDPPRAEGRTADDDRVGHPPALTRPERPPALRALLVPAHRARGPSGLAKHAVRYGLAGCRHGATVRGHPPDQGVRAAVPIGFLLLRRHRVPARLLLRRLSVPRC